MFEQTPEFYERQRQYSLECRAEIRDAFPRYFDDAYTFMSKTLRRFNHQKYLVFNHWADDTQNDLGEMSTLLRIIAECHTRRAEGKPVTAAYMRCIILGGLGILPFHLVVDNDLTGN